MDTSIFNTPIFTPKFEILRENSNSEEVFPKLCMVGKIQEANAFNNNGRKYKPETLVQKILEARCTEAQLKDSPLFGESIHPNDKLTGEINPEKIIWRLNEAHMVGDEMHGTLEIIPESPIGRVLYFLVEKYQAKPGISSRGFGAMNGDWVDHETYKFITFDGTFNPSTHGAFLNKIGESSDMKEMIKSFSSHDLEVLSENSILKLDSGKSVVENVFSKSKYHILNNKTKMSTELELLKESNNQVNDLTKKLAESNSALNAKIEEAEKLIEKNSLLAKKLQEAEEDAETAKADAKDAVDDKEMAEKKMKEMEDEDEEEGEEKEKLEENYNKSLEVLEGVVSEYHKVNGFYEKSLEVLNLMESQSTNQSVKNLVESELGDFEKYEAVFESVTDLDKASVIVESLKKIQSGNGPTAHRPLLERSNENGSTRTTPQSDDEQRISMYDI